MRYKSLLQEPTSVLDKVSEFLGLDCTQEQIEASIKRCSFKNMRSKEDKYGRPNKAWPSDKKFMRQGQAGSYLDEMPEDVQEAFMSVSLPTMKRLNYI